MEQENTLQHTTFLQMEGSSVQIRPRRVGFPGRKLTNPYYIVCLTIDAECIDSHVIARKSEALTWQSPGIKYVAATQTSAWYQEIATSLRSSQ